MRRVVALGDGEGAEPSLGAEGLTGALVGVQEAVPTPMYASQASRDSDIAVSGLAEHLGDVAGMRVLEVEVHHADLGLGYGPADWSSEFVTLLVEARSARCTGPAAFTVRADDLDRRWTFAGAGSREGGGSAGGSSDVGPTVSGPAASLAWWVVGRGPGEGLASDGGRMPQIGPW